MRGTGRLVGAARQPTPDGARRGLLRSRRAAPLPPAARLVLGFLGLIGLGTLALLLPFSARGGGFDPLTTLFTATSAVCVTGLVVVDTADHWAPFGQAVILALMQLGGLGFVIGVTALALFSGGRMSLRQRVALRESGSALRLGGQGGLIRRTVLLTLACEAVGALLLWLRFGPRFGWGHGLWLAVFHAVSAFTNGSFDLFGGFRSLADFGGDPVVLLTIAALIGGGGLSVIVFEDLRRHRRWRRLSLDSKLVLLGGPLLLLGGAALLFAVERQNPATLGGQPLWRQLLNALFHSAAARTAGFTTWDFARTDDRSLFFLLGLMFVGGAPGSMAGGIKLTTAGVLVAAVWGTLRGRPEVALLGRRLPTGQPGQAFAVAVLALALIANVALAISLLEGPGRHPFLSLLFEVTSAFGTVGTSVGIAPHLPVGGKLLLILTMFVGRLGPVTVGLALTARADAVHYRLPSEPVRIG